MKAITMTCLFILLAGFVALPALAQNVTDGLVAYWAFDDEAGDTASDSSGNGHDGTLMGDPQWVDGRFGGALEFDQVGDEVNVPYHENLNQETFTVCAWANVEPESAGHRALISSRNEPPVSGYLFYAQPNDTWTFIAGIGSTWSAVQGPAVKPGEWEHLAGVYADGKQKFYVNGELAGETDAAISLNTGQEFLIGAGANERATHEYLFKGIIDEVCIYDRALNVDEISSLMENNPTAVEASGKIAVTWGQLKAK